ncbi:MFS transporter [Paraburkholderia sp. RP-4-7]|uniref:MFS transporter n=2 Tax=Paraburkholderia polaris TaxID=2728848 RepID=A0A848IV89_9BURK|nr:MFS transporter [Paraburkholderia polaris]
MTNRSTQVDPLAPGVEQFADSPGSALAQAQVSPLQILTLVLCFFVVAADGFDVASVAFVGPLLQKTWALSPAELGPLFGAALVGLTVGSFLFGPLADRIGRKRVITISLVLFGIGSLACGYAPSARWLLYLRFATGLGLGGAMPNAITLSSEFSPSRGRATMVTLMFCGFTAGLAFGGAIASVLIPAFGWRGVFVFGGLFPLCLAPCVWIWLPESLHFMAGKPRFECESRRTLARLTGDPDMPLQRAFPEETKLPTVSRSATSVLFDRHYRAGTLLLWFAFFCTLWVYYQLASWLPTVLADAGSDAVRAARLGAMLPLGGTIGALINARLMDKINPFVVLAGSYAVAAVSITLIGFSLDGPALLYLTVFMAGLGLSGAQTGANVVVASFYTTAARATGVSWALGVGRLGSIVGALTGGPLLMAVHSPQSAFIVFAIPAVLAGVAMAANGYLYRADTA